MIQDFCEEIGWLPQQIMDLTPAQFFALASRYDDFGRPKMKTKSFGEAQGIAQRMQAMRAQWTKAMIKALGNA